MRTKRIVKLILVLGMLTGLASAAKGAEEPESQQEAIGQTPPRLSLTKSEVSFWRPGAEDWSQAQVNTPLAPGDQLYTGPQGNLEIQIGSRAFVRGGPNTQLGFENHEPDYLQFKVAEGSVSFDLRTVEPGRTVEVDTPNAVFTIEHAGYYRVDVSGERTSFITRRGGQATVTAAGGEADAIEPSEDVVIEGIESPKVTSYAAPQLDEWDKWNYARTDHLLDAVSARYVSPGVYGVDDLDRHGAWRNVPTYGPVWVPRGVPAGWAPYTTGTWMHDPYYGWTWVDTAPWGWAPYHYGRWVFVDGFWAWTPGPVVVRPAYAPALVAFFGGHGGGINVSIGVGSVVGWVALGWGEPCVPWWGPARIRHRPWWGGWGGPRVVNKTVVHHTTVVNVQEINVYRNAEVRNAVVAVHENHFGRGPVKPARVAHVDGKSLRPIHTAPQIQATPASFAPREDRGIRPPKKVLERSVVATRTPHRAKTAPAAVEGKTAHSPVPTPAPRIVSAPQKGETAPALRRPPFGQSRFERRTNDRARPPAPPKFEAQKRTEQASGGSPSVSRQRSSQKPREPEVAGPSAAKPQNSSRPSEADRTRTLSPPQTGTQRPAPQASVAAPAAAPQAPLQKSREPQATVPSAAKPQTLSRPPEADRTRAPEPPKMDQKRSEQAPGGARSMSRPTPQPRQHEPQVAGPSAARPQAAARPAEASRPPARVLPGEPANRLSPDRARPQQQIQRSERKESPRPARSDGNPEKVQQRTGKNGR